MISICLTAENKAVLRAASLLQTKLQMSLDPRGIPLTAFPAQQPSVSFDGKGGRIGFVSTVSFARMLTQFVKQVSKGKPFYLEETVIFDEVGISLDLSRGGVMKPEAVMEYMEYMAMMGLDYVLLYIEDIYTIPGLPYFGYMRGRYTEDELKRIDAHGAALGIEVIPMIQTASHLEHYLKWGENWKCRCSERTLLVGSEDTYTLIDQMLSTISRCFTSRRIHLGMDEAFDLNLAGYMDKNGLRDMSQVFAEHLTRVLEILAKYDRVPMVWQVAKPSKVSDPAALMNTPGADELITFVGAYSYFTEEVFLKRREPFLEFLKGDTSRLWYCGPIWTWMGPMPDNRLTLDTCAYFFDLCQKHGIRNMVGTVWGDDGCECNHFFSLFGAQIYAEYKYNSQVAESHIMERFEQTVGVSAQAFMDMSEFNMIPNRSTELSTYTNGHLYVHDFVGKKLLWQDIMVGMKDHLLLETPMSGHYAKYAERFAQYKKQDSRFQGHIDFAQSLFALMADKCAIAEQLKPRYLEKDLDYLRTAADRLLPELSEKVENTRKLHQKMWYATNKPFGFEVIDIRYGGVRARIESAITRLWDYLDGRVDRLEELEEPRLSMECQDSTYYTNILSSCTRRWM